MGSGDPFQSQRLLSKGWKHGGKSRLLGSRAFRKDSWSSLGVLETGYLHPSLPVAKVMFVLLSSFGLREACSLSSMESKHMKMPRLGNLQAHRLQPRPEPLKRASVAVSLTSDCLLLRPPCDLVSAEAKAAHPSLPQTQRQAGATH